MRSMNHSLRDSRVIKTRGRTAHTRTHRRTIKGYVIQVQHLILCHIDVLRLHKADLAVFITTSP
jgi:hypothetical protein